MSEQPVHVREIAGFELLAMLGEGGMGKVFKARQKSVDRIVALKVLTPKLSEDPDYVGRFEREAKAAGKLTHPNVVAVIDRGEDRNQGPKPIRWIAFEFVDGMSLEQRIEKGKVPEREALGVVRAVASALQSANQHGLVHRDIKPDNIFLEGRDSQARRPRPRQVRGRRAIAHADRDRHGDAPLHGPRAGHGRARP